MHIINTFIVGQVARLAEKCKIGIYSDTINVINVNLCMIVLPQALINVSVLVLLIELYLFRPLSVTLTILKGHSDIEQF